MSSIRGTSYYKIVQGPTWEQAETNSNDLGGHLVTINDAEENAWLVTQYYGPGKISESLSFKNLWIGFTDKESEGNWQWISGETASYTNWSANEPQGSHPESKDDYAGFGLIDYQSWRDLGDWVDDYNDSSLDKYGIAEVPLSYFSVSDLTITEGDSGNITISRTGGSNTVQNLTLASSNGTALGGTDYTAINQTITFAKGETSKTISIASIEDTTTESDETFSLTLTASSTDTVPAQISDGSATITITDDDSSQKYEVTVDSPSIIETDFGVKTLAFTVELDKAVSGLTYINYRTLTTGTAATGEDFVTSAGVVTFVKGQKVATLNISINGDADVEDDETIQVKFSGTALTSDVIATGTIKNNDIAGTDSNDKLNGSVEDDNIKGGGGADVIDGGAGIDTALYTGDFNDYSITKTTTTIQITDTRITSPDGVDTVQNIEYIQFSDQLVASDKVNVVKTFTGNFRDYKFYNKGNGNYEIKDSNGTTDDITGIPKLTFEDKTADESVSAIADIKGVFDQVTGKETPSGEMFRLYNAAFARFPDADGLKYWIDKFSSGADDARAVASSFLVSDEFSERYGANVSNAKYVETLYVNVLGRDYDQVGYNYWLGNLNSGTETRYELLLGFAEAAENKTLFTEMTGLA